MRRGKLFLPAILLTAIIFMAVSLPVNARYHENRPPSRPVLMQGLLEVQFESDVTENKLALSTDNIQFGIETLDKSLARIGAYSATRIFPAATEKNGLVGVNDLSKFYTVEFDLNIDPQTAKNELQQNPYVRTVDFIYAMPVDVNPNDPNFTNQWSLKKINDTAAYNIEAGSDTAKIAIIDSGVLYNHPDLIDNIWVNPGEDLDGDLAVYDADDVNFIDNDGNGYDDLIGYDFFAGFSGLTCWTGEDCWTPDSDPSDFNGHGTHCAGIAAAASNNLIGVAGVAGGWGGGVGAHTGPRIICLRAGGSAVDPDFGWEGGFIRTDNAASAVSYAVDVGACSINMSFGMSQLGSMTTALLKARDSGVVVAHSAGNEGSEMSGYYDTYAPDGQKLVISVAWTNSADRKDGGSNYGTWIDISAPGTNIYNTYSSHYSSTYSYLSGSSMASPHVAGLVGLIKSHVPDYRRDEIMPLIYDNADEMPSETLWLQGKMGAGRINAYKCLDSLPSPRFTTSTPTIGEAPLAVDFVDESPFNPTTWDWDFGDGNVSSDQNPSNEYTDYGYYNVTMTTTDDFGTGTEVQNKLVMVTADTIAVGTVSAKPYDTVDVEVYVDNKFPLHTIVLPIKVRKENGSIPNYIYLDSVIVEGTRASYFDRIRKQTSDNVNKKYTWVLYSNYYGGSDYLPPDTGLTMKLRFRTDNVGASEILIISDTLISSNELTFESNIYDYTPVFVQGRVTVSTCDRGDANLDESINILDITLLIDWLYQGGWWPPDPVCGDVNADFTINILDITYLIAYLYNGGPPPPE